MLDHYIAIYIPNKQDMLRVASDILARMTELFGGCSAYSAKGMWKNSDGTIYNDDITVCKSFFDSSYDHTDDALYSIKELALTLKKAIDEISIAIEMDGKMWYV